MWRSLAEARDDFTLHLFDRDRSQVRAATDDFDVISRRNPDGGIGWSEQKQTRHAERRSEVTDAGIVTEKKPAPLQPSRQFMEWEIDGEVKRIAANVRCGIVPVQAR